MSDDGYPYAVGPVRTAKGAWTRSTLAEYGIPWPPPKGWKAKLEAEGFDMDGVDEQEYALGPDGTRQHEQLTLGEALPVAKYEWTVAEALEVARQRIPGAIDLIKQQADFRGEPLTGAARQALVLDMAVALGFAAGKGDLEK